MSKATEDQLNLLHGIVTQKLIDEISDEECSPAMMAQAIKMLKDNDVTASIHQDEGMHTLSDALKAKRDKRKLRIVPGE
jgi:ABC-type Zn uptake system ZnuABC Zn-binding protein ZnuA